MFFRNSKPSGSTLRSEHFWTFRCLRNTILPSGETTGLPFPKWPFFPTFRRLERFLPEIRKGRFPLLEVLMFGCYGDRECVFSPLAKRLTYRLRNDFFPMFRHMRKFYPRTTKRLGSRNTSAHFRKFWSLRKRILGVGKTASLPVAKWPFFRCSAPLKFPPEILTAGFPFANWPFLDVSVPGNRILTSGETAGLPLPKWPLFDFSAPEKFPPDIRNAWVPFRIVNIYGRFGAWESVFSPTAKRPAYRSRNDHFPTFRHLK